MLRVDNFSAGPCTLPDAVLQELAEELPEINSSGMSIIEISHRSADYSEVHEETKELIVSLANVPDDFEVLLLQGGATLQFAMAAQNLDVANRSIGYIVTGAWGQKAFADANQLGQASVIWDGATTENRRGPTPEELDISDSPDFIHLTTNETIHGVSLPTLPQTAHRVVADMSSDFLTRNIDWDTIAIAYAGAQKSLGPAGLCVAIVHSSVIDEAPELPTYLSYAKHAKGKSVANTPPVFSIWGANKMLKWMKAEGGLEEMKNRTKTKASAVYSAIDSSEGFYIPRVDPDYRSRTNVVFNLADENQEQDFLAKCVEQNLMNLKGHRSIGGIRASLYNGLKVSSAQRLAEFMNDYRKSA